MKLTLAPPQPKGYFLLGNTLDFARNPLAFLSKCANDFDGIVSVQLPIGKPYLVTHPDFVEYVFVTGSRNFKKGTYYDGTKPLLGNGLVTSDGELWLKQRKLIQPVFHRAKIRTYSEVMVNFTENLLTQEWRDGQVRPIEQDMMQLTMQIVARLLFSMDFSGEEAKETGQALGNALTEVTDWMNSPVKLPLSVPTPRNRRFRAAIQLVDQVIGEVITRGRNQDAAHDKGDLLSMLFAAHDQDGQGMSDQQLRDEVVTLYAAGHETTAMTLTWAWYLLSQHPQVEKKLVAELQNVLNGRSPGIDDLPHLSYTDMIIKETLRLYPSGWLVARQAINDCQIGDYPIPAGTVVLVSAWATHRDPRFFEEPEEFKPERWEAEAVKKLHKYAYYPFAAGPRQCIGNVFATTEAVLLLATMAQQYRLELLPGKPVTPVVRGTLHPSYPLQMKLSKRG